MFYPLARYVLTAAIKDRLMLGFLAAVAILYGLCVFMGSSAITEKEQFALTFVGGSLRLIYVTTLSLFTVFFVRRCFDNKDIEFLLARPISRVNLLLAFSCGASFLAMLLALIVSAVVIAASGSLFSYGTLLWALSLLAEGIVVVNACLFFAMYISNSVNALLAVLGFYVLARLNGQILGILDVGGFSAPHLAPVEFAMKAISVLVPRLDLMAQTSWLVYGAEESFVGIGYIFLQALIFSALVMAGAVFDFIKRQF